MAKKQTLNKLIIKKKKFRIREILLFLNDFKAIKQPLL